MIKYANGGSGAQTVALPLLVAGSIGMGAAVTASRVTSEDTPSDITEGLLGALCWLVDQCQQSTLQAAEERAKRARIQRIRQRGRERLAAYYARKGAERKAARDAIRQLST